MKAIAYRPKDCNQIQKATFDGDVGDVTAPNLIRPRDCELPQKVWINTVLWVLLAGVRPLWMGQYDFSEEKLRDTIGILPPKKAA